MLAPPTALVQQVVQDGHADASRGRGTSQVAANEPQPAGDEAT